MENPTNKPTQIAIAVVEREGAFLIGQRPPGVPLAGYWEFPGGKVHAAESPSDAARRECLEETGFSVEVVGEYAPCRFVYEHGTVDLRFFRCEARSESQLSPNPPFRWVSKEALPTYRFPEANASLLRELTKSK